MEPLAVAPEQNLFVTTRWSVVLKAKDKSLPGSAEALETLCRTYWYPIYALVRSLGHSPADAEDLTQEFFAKLLEKDYLRIVEREKGRFRTFLRMALKRFLANEWDRIRAQKRGGALIHIPFGTEAEERFRTEPTDALSPDRIFDRRWALNLLDQALERLEHEYVAAGKSTEWQLLKSNLIEQHTRLPYAEVAAALHSSEGAARVMMHRMRKRFREVFRETVADTVSTTADLEREMREVLEALSQA